MTTSYLLYRPLLDQDGKPVVRNPKLGEHWLDKEGNLEFDTFDEPRPIYVRVTNARVIEPCGREKATHYLNHVESIEPIRRASSTGNPSWEKEFYRMVHITPPPPAVPTSRDKHFEWWYSVIANRFFSSKETAREAFDKIHEWLSDEKAETPAAVPEWEREFDERFGSSIYREQFRNFIRELLEKERKDGVTVIPDTNSATVSFSPPSDAPKWPCPKCGQRPEGQGGEYPCEVCGLPKAHDRGCPCSLCNSPPSDGDRREKAIEAGADAGLKYYEQTTYQRPHGNMRESFRQAIATYEAALAGRGT